MCTKYEYIVIHVSVDKITQKMAIQLPDLVVAKIKFKKGL